MEDTMLEKSRQYDADDNRLETILTKLDEINVRLESIDEKCDNVTAAY